MEKFDCQIMIKPISSNDTTMVELAPLSSPANLWVLQWELAGQFRINKLANVSGMEYLGEQSLSFEKKKDYNNYISRRRCDKEVHTSDVMMSSVFQYMNQ